MDLRRGLPVLYQPCNAVSVTAGPPLGRIGKHELVAGLDGVDAFVQIQAAPFLTYRQLS